jgi:hypothetical protein
VPTTALEARVKLYQPSSVGKVPTKRDKSPRLPCGCSQDGGKSSHQLPVESMPSDGRVPSRRLGNGKVPTCPVDPVGVLVKWTESMQNPGGTSRGH